MNLDPLLLYQTWWTGPAVLDRSCSAGPVHGSGPVQVDWSIMDRTWWTGPNGQHTQLMHFCLLMLFTQRSQK